MANRIHPLAAVDPAAEIGEDCEIGPFCVIGPDVTLGPGCRLHSHVVVDGHTRIGAGCTIFPFASVGVQSQDLKFRPGNLTYTEIGEQTLIREHVTIHSGTEDGSSTRVGSHCALLALSGKKQVDAARRVVAGGLSVRATEALVKQLQSSRPAASKAAKNPDVLHLEARLSDTLGAQVVLLPGRNGKGKLEIRYNSLDELDGILEHIN